MDCRGKGIVAGGRTPHPGGVISMRIAFLALAVTFAASAQTITFAPQPFSRIPGLQEYRVYVAAPENQPMQVQGMKVMLEAIHQNIRMYSYVNLRAYVDDYNRRSIPHYIGIVFEIGGWTMTAAQSTDVVKIREKYKAAIPLVTAAMTLTRTLMDRNHPPITIPADLMQPLMAVPAGQAIEFALFAPQWGAVDY